MDDSDEPTAPPPRPPVVLAGSAVDAKLRLSLALSREEVLRRRRRRLMQLYSLYRSQFWALADELPAKHGEYWWEHGASPVVELSPPALPPPPAENGGGAASMDNAAAGGMDAFSSTNCGPPLPSENGGCGAVTPAAAGGRAACSAANCRAKAMPLSLYCFDHILLDPKQQLYKPCTFITKQSSTPNGQVTCGKPVLRGITPLRCSDHDPKTQKNIIEALRSVGIDLPLTSKSVPKLNLLISETVRQIQMKRKLSMDGGKTAPSHI